MYFPSFFSRLRSVRKVHRNDDILSNIDEASRTDITNCPSTIYESSTSPVTTTPATTPAASEGSGSPKLGASSVSKVFFRLDLPPFTPLVDELPDSWHSLKTEDSPSVLHLDRPLRDGRDVLIEDLLDQIKELRQKVRALGDDNSRLRLALTRKRSQELISSDLRQQQYVHNNQPGAPINIITVGQDSSTSSGDEVKSDSQDDYDSAYSYYHNPDYFPASLSARPRARTESERAITAFGTYHRPRYYSLPTPKQMKEYAELRPKDGTKLELGPRLRELISLRCSVPVAQNKPPTTRTSSSTSKKSVCCQPTPTWSLRRADNKFVRRPQPRIQLYSVEPIFRCFTCSHKYGHCAYADGIWLYDRYVYFGYFEMVFYHAAFGRWGPANMISEPINSSNSSTESVYELVIEPCAESGGTQNEVDVPLIERTPSNACPLLDNTPRQESDADLLSNDAAVSDAQRRRERHIALLDSIMEEEELDEIAPGVLIGPTVASPLPRPVFASKLTQSTLASIPEHDDDREADAPDSTTSLCPVLTEDRSSSRSPTLEEFEDGNRSPVTFDDFEDLDFQSIALSAGDDSKATMPAMDSGIALRQVNTVPFPKPKALTDPSGMSWWEVTISSGRV